MVTSVNSSKVFGKLYSVTFGSLMNSQCNDSACRSNQTYGAPSNFVHVMLSECVEITTYIVGSQQHLVFNEAVAIPFSIMERRTI